MRTTAALLLALSLAAGCESTESTDAIGGPGEAARLAGGNKILDVLSRNLYLGADLTPALAATDLSSFVAAVTAIWLTVQGNDFDTRVEALADEIADARPALIGLQEAYVWRIDTPADGAATPATEVVHDYVAELLAALADRGVRYRVAAELELFDFEAPTALGYDVRMTDHAVILARVDVKTADPVAQVFADLLPVSVLGQTIFVERGYVAVDVKYRGEWLRFVSTHLEAFHPGIRTLQAVELAAALGTDRPTILVGDLNSEPGTEGAAVLAAAGFADVWPAVRPGEPGLTCCWPEDLHDTSPGLDERIDYVLSRGALEPLDADVLGDELDDRVGGLWPSDHAGVVATLRLIDPRFAP